MKERRTSLLTLRAVSVFIICVVSLIRTFNNSFSNFFVCTWCFVSNKPKSPISVSLLDVFHCISILLSPSQFLGPPQSFCHQVEGMGLSMEC